MRHRALPFAIIALVGGLLAGRVPGWAAPATFVSGTGTDAGTCPVTAPCATFQFAHDHTDAKGVISVVSPGSFGPVTITKAISIVANGVPALILTATASCGGGGIGAGVCVDAGATDVVHLQGLTIDLKAVFRDGINFVAGAALELQNSAIQNTGSNGVDFIPTGVSSLFVTDTTIAGGNIGIAVIPAQDATANAILLRVHVENTVFDGFFFGYLLSGNGKLAATVRDSAVSDAGSNAIFADKIGGGTQTVDLMVDQTATLNSGTGVQATGSGVTVRIGDSTITGNTTGLGTTSGATIASFATNKLIGNGDDTTAQLGVGRRR
jgi:hypothetical protein